MPIVNFFSSTDKVPGFYGQTLFGQSGVGAASQPLYLLLVGNMLSTGSALVDVGVDDVFSEADAVLLYGAGSELHRMVRVALKYPGVRLKAIAVSEAGGAAAATCTTTLTGSWTTAGSLVYRVGGERVQANVTSTNTLTEAAAAIKAACNANAALPVTFDNVAGVGTWTAKQKGTRGNTLIVAQDMSQAPAGLVSTTTGGAAVGLTGHYFSGGSGLDDVTAALAVLFPGWYQRVALAQGDATNVALVKAQVAAKAGPTEGRMEHYVIAGVGSLAATQSIAQTTANDQRAQSVWLANGETPASEMAASMAAMRTKAEQDQPNSGYDNRVLLGVLAQEKRADWVGHSTAVAALDNSLTPLYSQEDGTVTVVRAITTHSKSGAAFDYSTLDTAQAVVPDYMRLVYRLSWTTQFVVANPYVRPEPSAAEPTPVAGQAYPSLWQSELLSLNQDAERASILTQASRPENRPVVDYDYTANRIVAISNVTPLPLHHQTLVSVRQTSVIP